MEVFVCRLHLQGFLTFSSTTGLTSIGGVSYTVYKPAPVLHNYPLMYAFAGLAHGSLASMTWSLRDVAQGKVPQPDYALLSEIEKMLYVYPARPVVLNIKRMLSNIGGEDLAHVQPRPKAMYPWHVVHFYFTPGSVFETVVIKYRDDVKLPSCIRLGAKRYAVFRVEYRKAAMEEKLVQGYTDPVNLGDTIKWRLEPDAYTVLLETKTLRKGFSESNTIVKAYYARNVVSIVKAKFSKHDEAVFRLVLPKPLRGIRP